MRLSIGCLLGALALVAAAQTAFAQDEPQAPMPFEGGTLTITETGDLDKVLAFDGKELARNYLVYYEKTVELIGFNVALFRVGEGGNLCGAAQVIVWKDRDDGIRMQAVGDCDAPPAAVTDGNIYFVPFLLPGETDTVQRWSPYTGLEVAGTISYAPQPGTDWKDLDPAKFEAMVDSMRNAAVYAAAQELLGEKLREVVTGLLTGGDTVRTPSGIYYASGCVPHNCGAGGSFMAIDPKAQQLYFAQDSGPQPSTWPELGNWPVEIEQLMTKAFQPEQ